MKPVQIIELKTDNRYKDGNIQVVKNKLRGNSKTMELKHLVVPLHNYYEQYYRSLSLQLQPPIIVSDSLGEKIKELL